MQILGYSIIETIYEGNRNIIYRAVDNDKHVILKVIKNEYPTESDLLQFQNEYRILEKFKGLDGIAEVIRLEKFKNRLLMIFKDSKAESLDSLISKKIPLYTFHKIAKSIVKAIEKIHEKKFIHKDIKPSNILYNSNTGHVQIIDFGSCSEMGQDFSQSNLKGNMEGSLTYISPEQTGRMNRLVDYRTDYYSLGATLYHLLTGRPPFIASDPKDLIYSHIAKEPLPPNLIEISIPNEISQIILKLLAKNPEERYLSSYGILHDLDWIISDKYKKEIFIPGKKDFPLNFQIPNKLYGRDEEFQTLIDSFFYMYGGVPVLSVILGKSGIGKSALVKELYKTISANQAYFVSGEYDLDNKNIPYSGFLKAFSILIHYILSETLEEIKNWKERILSKLGKNVKFITEVIPELKLIIGEQPDETTLNPVENSNRFQLIFHNFIKIFCTLNHPLVLFLDDLQWADQASLQLIKNLMSDSSIKYMHIILSYQTTKNSYITPFFEVINSLKKENIIPRIIKLHELKTQDICKLLSDCFYSSNEEVLELAEILYTKTGGNPFFINEVLGFLSKENKIYPDHKNGKWKYDLDKIKNTQISENIIDLLINRIKKLPQDSQLVLGNAAFIGQIFDLYTICVLVSQPFQKIMNILKELIKQDFLFLTDESIRMLKYYSEESINASLAKQIIFQFKHDRIQQAAFELVEKSAKINLQLTIGRIQLKENYSEENLFNIVNHLNAGSDNITDVDEKMHLIDLNLKAAKVAKLSTAYVTALQYLNKAFKIVHEFNDPWKEIYSHTVQVYRELSEMYYLNTQFDKLEECISELLKNTNNLSEIADSFKLLINYYTTTSNYAKAIDSGREVLRLFNIMIPSDNLDFYIKIELKKINRHLKVHSVQSIFDSTKMKEESNISAIGILSTLMPPAYLYNSQLWVFIVLKSVSFLLYHGYSEYIYGYSCYGIILCSMFSDYKKGHEFALLALKIAEQNGNKAEFTKATNVMANYTLPYREHLKNAEIVNLRGLDSGRESGEFQHASYCLIFNALNAFYLGKNLTNILQDIIPKHILLCKQTKSSLGKDTINALRITLLAMTDNSDSEKFRENEANYLIDWKNNNNIFSIFIFKSLQACRFYFQEKYFDSYNLIVKCKKYQNYAIGLYSISELNFFESLVLCALSAKVDTEIKKEYIHQIKLNQKQMIKWANSCPENFQHKYLLVEAELSRINGKYWKASKLFDDAIEEARKNEFMQYEALANELCARLYGELGKMKIMRSYLLEAHYLYNRWGAIEKIKQIEDKYSDFFPKTNQSISYNDSQENILISNIESQEKFSNVGKLLDLNSLIKASQTLAEEIVIENLLKIIMRILFENAGAEKGLFIKYQNEDYIILAKGNSKNEEIEIYNSDSPTNMIALNSDIAATSIVNYVGRVKKYIVIGDAQSEEFFINDEYLRNKKPKSILCYPVIRHENLIGIIYLENNYTTHAFTKERLEVLNLLSTQIAISIENSELYANLEAKVEERTANLNLALQQVKILKEKQDGDYFLTSLLIHPLGKNNTQSDSVQIDFFIEQKKKFLFKTKEVEIGGDLCTADRIFINHRTYIVILNADAMGKSIQGAGGILVLGSVFKSILHRTQSEILNNFIYPEKWIKNSFLEMQRIFESFDGYMLISLVLGLLDEENGIFYYMNVEHPSIVLYRNKKARFIEKDERKFLKMGIHGINSPLHISLFQMNHGDVLIIGSDGRDDIILGKDENGLDILNFDENLFLEFVEQGNGNLKEIYNSILSKGILNDDISLLRIGFKEFEHKSEIEILKENQLRESMISYLKNEISIQNEKNEYELLINSYEELISLKPLATEYFVNISILFLKMKQYKKFIEYAEIVKLRSPDNIQNKFRLILAHIRLKNYQSASSLINEILYSNAENERAKKFEQFVAELIIKSF